MPSKQIPIAAGGEISYLRLHLEIRSPTPIGKGVLNGEFADFQALPLEFKGQGEMARIWNLGYLAGFAMVFAGCATMKTTNTARTAKEQLLVSNSIDQALNKVDFSAFSGAKVFIDEKYLDCVDKNYVIGSVRHRALRSGARVVEKSEEAEVIMEVRSGGVGTNTSDMFVGIPEISLPIPLPVSVPEIRLMSKQEQSGIAKIGIMAYDAKTRQMLGDGGITLAQSNDKNWYVFGVGPYQNGSIQQEVANGLKTPPATYQPLPYNVAFDKSPTGAPADPGTDRVRWAGSTDEDGEVPALEPAFP